jgi:hypothetical protein
MDVGDAEGEKVETVVEEEEAEEEGEDGEGDVKG